MCCTVYTVEYIYRIHFIIQIEKYVQSPTLNNLKTKIVKTLRRDVIKMIDVFSEKKL